MNIILSATITNSITESMKPALLVLGLILAALVISCIVFTAILARSGGISIGKKIVLAALYVTTLTVLLCTFLCFRQYQIMEDMSATETANSPSATQTTAAPETEATTEPPTEPPTEPDPTVAPAHTEKSDPANWKVKWSIMQNGTVLDSFQRNETIDFGDASQYSALDGIVTFRGDNYRTGASFGTTDMVSQTLTKKWSAKIGSLKGANGNWTGCGWTGQPLIVRWDDETKAILGLYEEKKEKEGLVEVIYATLDGHIYFYDLEDGSYTRDPIRIGMSFKGAGSLDPRGYPLMYVGSGDSTTKSPRMYIVSLIENKVIYEQSGSDIDAYRKWYAFDSAPLVAAEADTLIWPGESGILYTIKLNTAYNPSEGTITVSPENTAKTRYKTNTGHKIGCEASSIIVGNHIYYGDNGGMFFCVDLQTMELKWAQYTRDDINATPVFEWGEDGVGYIYIGTSMEYAKGNTYIYKLNANTGEIVWERKFTDVAYNERVSGGVLSSPLLGKKGTELEGLIIYPIARTPSVSSGTIVALNTETGETVWEVVNRNYHWSSPVAVYGSDGKAHFILCDSAGKATLYNAAGEVINTLSLGSNIEASPAVFENTLVVGTRGQTIYGVSIE